MTQQLLTLGAFPNDATGTPMRTGGQIINANFTELYMKLAQTVSVTDFGADSAGVADSTAAIQAALNSGAKAVFVPPGTFKFSALVMPTILGFVFYGVGPVSQLIQTGTGISWPVNLGIGYYSHTIKSLGFNSVSGTGHTIDTSYTGGTTLDSLYFTDTPSGFDNLHLDGSSTTYTHDIRVLGLQIYKNSGSGGHAGIGLGAHLSDSSIDGWIMNASDGAFGASYCLWVADGAQSTTVSNSHPYNAITNVVGSATTGVNAALGMSFVNCILDHAFSGDNVSVTNWNCPIFSATWFQAVSSGHNALTLINCRSAVVNACRFDGAAGSHYMVNEIGTTDYTNVLGGDSPSGANFFNPQFNFIVGNHSIIKNFIATNIWGQLMAYSGCTAAQVAANTTTYLGANGANATYNNTAWPVNLPSGMNVLRCDISFDTAPGASTFQFTLVGAGVTMTAATGYTNPVTVTGAGVFSASILIAAGAAQFLAFGNQMAIKVVTGAAAPNVNFRYSITTLG